MNSVKPIHAGIVFALITAIGLGAITTQAKIFYSDGGNAMTLMLTRFLLSTLVFGLLIAFKRRVFSIDRRQRLAVFILGFIWSGSMICYLLSVESISVSLAVLVLYTYPLLVLIYSVLSRQVSPLTRADIGILPRLCGTLSGIIERIRESGYNWTAVCVARGVRRSLYVYQGRSRCPAA